MEKVTICFSNGLKREYDQGISLLAVSSDVQTLYTTPIVAVQVNNEIKDLRYSINNDCTVEFFDLTTDLGIKVYQRSLIFVMLIAAQELFPTARLAVEHSLGKGLYCELHLGRTLTEQDIKSIEERMRLIVAERRPIYKKVLSTDKAIELFMDSGLEVKAKLLRQIPNEKVSIYYCGDTYNYFYRTLVPDTGYTSIFSLELYAPGFILRYPVQESGGALPAFVDQPKLAEIFLEAEHWAALIGCDYIPSLNERIEKGEINEIIRISEALHEKKIAQIADYIAARGDDIHVVIIAGPSSSGKTTFAGRLGVQLHVNGLVPVTISLDDYFIDRDKMQVNDLESIKIVDLDLFNDHLSRLIDGEEIELPSFNFKTGKREYHGKKTKFTNGQIMIIESIHGLNVEVAKAIPRKNKVKIYINALTQIAIDPHNRIPTTDARLIRRIVRDSQFRAYSALDTLRIWAAVRHGEEGNIFPYGEEADIMFNSALLYEQAILKKYAIPLLKQVKPDQPEYSEAKRLIRMLSYFYEGSEAEVPLNSILREFIGKP